MPKLLQNAWASFTKNPLKFVVFALIWIIWELLSDRLLQWANNKLDENAEGIMNSLAQFTKSITSAPITWTISIVVIVLLAMFAHAYWVEYKNSKAKTSEAESRYIGRRRYRQKIDDNGNKIKDENGKFVWEEVPYQGSHVVEDHLNEILRDTRNSENQSAVVDIDGAGDITLAGNVVVGNTSLIKARNTKSVIAYDNKLNRGE